jgi:hypothetical protein
MTSPGGKPVAQVSVRVVPDTDGFSDKLRRELADLPDATVNVKPDLDRAELRRQLEELRNLDVTIPVNFDVENARDDIRRATEGAQANKVKVPVEVDQSALDESLASVGKNVKAIQVPAELDEAKLQAEIARVKAQLDELDNRQVTPHVELLQTSFQRQLTELKAELAALQATRVQIPVEADTSRVNREIFDLKATLAEFQRNPVQVGFDANDALLRRKIAEIEALLAKMDGETITPEIQANIDAALAKLSAYQRELDALDGKRIRSIAELDVDTIKADARILAFVERMRLTRKIKLQTEVDDRSMADTDRRLGRLFQGIGDRLAQVFDAVGGVIGGIVDNIGGITRGLTGAVTVAARFAVILAAASAVSTGLAIAGAGITAAWGAVSTAIAGIPGAIALIGAPIAAVALGMDGIKKAAQGIKPQFDALKASVSDVFEKGLAPILTNIATRVFPSLKVGLTDTARAMVDLAGGVADVVIRAADLGQLKTIFDNVNTSIRNMTPGIQDLVGGFLLVAQQKGAFDAITAAVNTFGAAFKRSVIDLISNGTLAAAFEGLKGTLVGVTQGFADLVKNGITVFANAAPGINHLLDSLTGFFNRFDWASLGRSVGGVFDGLASALDRIPQGTIDGITASFQRLSDTFRSAQFQQALVDIAGAIPAVISALNGLIQAFLRVGFAATGFVQVIIGVGRTIGTLFAAINDPAGLISGKFKGEFDKASQEVNDGFANIGRAFSSWTPPPIPGVGPSLNSALVQPFAGAVAAVNQELGKLQPATTVSLHNVDEAITRGSQNWQASAQQGASQVPPAVGAALQPTAGVAADALGQVPPAANAALAPLAQLQALDAMEPQFLASGQAATIALTDGFFLGLQGVPQVFQRSGWRHWPPQ